MRKTLVLALLCVVGLRAQPQIKTLNELRTFYAAHCVRCHGADGSAHEPDGKKLGGRDFTDSVKMAKLSDATMVKRIQKGIFFGLVMPPFKQRLSEPETRLLVTEVLRKAEKGKVIAPSE